MTAVSLARTVRHWQSPGDAPSTPARMAFLTPEEFGAAIGVLAEHHGVERLRERFARMNAFTSRRGLNSATAIADRLFALSGALRRQVAATLAFSSLWQELVGARLGHGGEKGHE